MAAITISNAQFIPTTSTYGVYSQIADSTPVAATTVSGSLVGAGVGGLSINPNFFQVGDSFYAELGGIISAKSNDDIKITVKSGSTILADTGFQNLSVITNGVWNLNLQFTIRAIGGPGVAAINTIGKFLDNKTSNQAISGFAFNSLNNTTFDTTIVNTLTIEAQWNSADPLNSIYSTSFVLSKIF